MHARGEFPRTMFEVMTREKDIRYSSRIRATTDQFKHVQEPRRAAAGLLETLADELKNSPEAQFLHPAVDYKVYNIVHLIYRAKNYDRPLEGLRIFARRIGGTLARRLS